jgi:hypothetical protein
MCGSISSQKLPSKSSANGDAQLPAFEKLTPKVQILLNWPLAIATNLILTSSFALFLTFRLGKYQI